MECGLYCTTSAVYQSFQPTHWNEMRTTSCIVIWRSEYYLHGHVNSNPFTMSLIYGHDAMGPLADNWKFSLPIFMGHEHGCPTRCHFVHRVHGSDGPYRGCMCRPLKWHQKLHFLIYEIWTSCVTLLLNFIGRTDWHTQTAPCWSRDIDLFLWPPAFECWTSVTLNVYLKFEVPATIIYVIGWLSHSMHEHNQCYL